MDNKQTTTAIIQARVGSTRLSSKALLELPYGSGITLLEQVIRRAQDASSVNSVIVATTEKPEDNVIAEIAEKRGVSVFRGSEENVLERYYLCAKNFPASHIVRLTADNPCIDGKIIDRYIAEHLANKNDYTGTIGYPLGTNTEIFSFGALEQAHANAVERNDLEHVTPYIRRNQNEAFMISYPEAQGIFNKPDLRLTVDTKEDYALACSIYDELYDEDSLFSLDKVIRLIEKKPWLASINQGIQQKKPLETLEEELEEVSRIAKLQDLRKAYEYIEKARKNDLLERR
jgi:spore coat polysaccharide biosynthesis protein SpsF